MHSQKPDLNWEPLVSERKLLTTKLHALDFKVNESALEVMVRIKNESSFSWQHPLIEWNDISMCLFNGHTMVI